MKTFFVSIFLAVVSIPVGVLSGFYYMSHAIRPTLAEAAYFGGTVNGVILFLSLMVFLSSVVWSRKPAKG